MPPAIAEPNLPPPDIIEISDDEDGLAQPDVPAQTMPLRETNPSNPTLASTMNIRLKPDTSPAWRDSKRQKLDDDDNAPEASGSRSQLPQYPRVHLEFADIDEDFATAYPAFFDDAFAPDYHNSLFDSSPDPAAHPLQRAAEIQPRPPPYYFDAKLNIRMYCGPGHEQFPLPVEHDPSFQEFCEAFDVHGWGDGDQSLHKDSPVTVAQQDCLARVLDVFPSIQHKFVLDKIRSQHELIQFPDEEIEMHPDSATIIHEILEIDSYPKQADAEEQPREEFEDRLGKSIAWSRDHYKNPNYKKDAIALLASHFDHVPTHYISSTVMEKGNLFDAYLRIEDIESDYFQGDRPYNRSKRPRVQLEKKYQTLDPQRDPPYYCSLVVELQAAKQQFLRKTLESNQRQQIADAETANLEQHRLNGLLVQCQCCFDDEVPMNRAVVCTAKEEHPFCYDCVKSLAENQIGMKKHQMQCMDGSGCTQNLDNDGIGKAVPIKIFDRLQFNQQQAEIRAANIEGLEQCPLCDFQAICDPPEIVSIFSCQNPDCLKVTCRLCHEISHLPKTCEEVKKDRGLSARHRIEEARTKAMIRTCPSCQSAIIKSDGCNKMRCTCGTVICYACKSDLSKLRDGYEHFDRGPATGGAGKKCPLYDDKFIDRHVQETNEAEEKAIQEAKAEDSTIEENTLRIETGKGKGVDHRGRNAVQGGPVRQMNNLPGPAYEDHLRHLAQHEASNRDRRGPRRNMAAQVLRNTQWLEGLRQRLPQTPLPVIPGVEPPQGGQPGQCVGPGGFNAPIGPNIHNPNQNAQNLFGNPYGAVGRDYGHFQGNPATNFGQLNFQNQNQNQNCGHNYNTGFANCGQPPQPNDRAVIDEAYMGTAQRIHEARDQQERRRRGQVERRNTVHNEVPLQAPNPEILNVRNGPNIFAQQPVQHQNNCLNNGTGQALHEAQHNRIANAARNNAAHNNGHDDGNDTFGKFLRARQAFYDRNQAPEVGYNQNTTRNRAPQQLIIQDHNQNQNQNRAPAFGIQPAAQVHDWNQPQPPVFGTQHPNQTPAFGQQTRAPPPWTIAPPGQNLGNANVGVPVPGRPNRRQTMPLDGINGPNAHKDVHVNGFGDPNFRW